MTATGPGGAPGWVPRPGAVAAPRVGDPDPTLSGGPRVRIVERFEGQRLRQRTGGWRRMRSLVSLLVLTLLVGAAVATVLAGAVAAVAYLIHQATSG